MPVISSYALQYSNVNFSAISSSTFDLFITEGDGDNSPFIAPPLTDAQVAALTAQGRTVVGYVNVAVTDANRSYWQDSWTTAGAHPRHDDDLNPVAASAPAWLQTQPTNSFGIIVEFTHADWKSIVIGQAVALVQRGYSGVFLDDVGAYYTLGAPGGVPGIRQMANAMCQFVAEIEAAIVAVNPNAYVVVNSDPYLHTNVTADATGAQAAAAYLAAVDAHLLENQGAAAIDYAQTSLAGETRLILESDGSPAYSYADSWARGILYTAPQSYNALGTFAYPATSGADNLQGGDGPNQISGLAGDDVLSGGAGADTLDGGTGSDSLIGGDGNDYASGGDGADYLEGGAGNDALEGGADNDIIHGGTGSDNLIGGDGNDYSAGGDGVDYFEGGAGNDALEGGADNDIIHGGTGSDNLIGGDGNDYASGGDGVDYLEGGAGNDSLEGGAGADILVGGGGVDGFGFLAALGGGNIDQVADFAVGSDYFYLDDAVFAGLAPGALPAGAFVTGAAAADANDRIVYNAATGALLFDADGSGAGAAVQFASVGTGLALGAADFVVI